jgi:thioredoxin-related protein
MTALLSRISLLIIIIISPPIQATELPLLTDIKKDSQLASSQFLLILVSQPNCSYCRLIEEDILKPMQTSGRYNDLLLFRNLIINDGYQLTDLDGNQLSANQFALRYTSSLTPTLLFIDPMDGSELTEKMIGINTVDMYGFYVDKAIDKAHRQLLSRH